MSQDYNTPISVSYSSGNSDLGSVSISSMDNSDTSSSDSNSRNKKRKKKKSKSSSEKKKRHNKKKRKKEKRKEKGNKSNERKKRKKKGKRKKETESDSKPESDSESRSEKERKKKRNNKDKHKRKEKKNKPENNLTNKEKDSQKKKKKEKENQESKISQEKKEQEIKNNNNKKENGSEPIPNKEKESNSKSKLENENENENEKEPEPETKTKKIEISDEKENKKENETMSKSKLEKKNKKNEKEEKNNKQKEDQEKKKKTKKKKEKIKNKQKPKSKASRFQEEIIIKENPQEKFQSSSSSEETNTKQMKKKEKREKEKKRKKEKEKEKEIEEGGGEEEEEIGKTNLLSSSDQEIQIISCSEISEEETFDPFKSLLQIKLSETLKEEKKTKKLSSGSGSGSRSESSSSLTSSSSSYSSISSKTSSDSEKTNSYSNKNDSFNEDEDDLLASTTKTKKGKRGEKKKSRRGNKKKGKKKKRKLERRKRRKRKKKKLSQETKRIRKFMDQILDKIENSVEPNRFIDKDIMRIQAMIGNKTNLKDKKKSQKLRRKRIKKGARSSVIFPKKIGKNWNVTSGNNQKTKSKSKNKNKDKDKDKDKNKKSKTKNVNLQNLNENFGGWGEWENFSSSDEELQGFEYEYHQDLSTNSKGQTKELKEGIFQFNLNPKKGMKYCIENGLVGNDYQKIAHFLFTTEGLGKRQVGDFLGLGTDYANEVLRHYANCFDFTEQSIDQALRKYLGTFRIPGEAQKIDRMMETFAMRFCSNNPTVFTSPDTAYVLSFSMIMLNTDAHSPMVENKMTKQQFFLNCGGIDDGKDLPEEILSEIYDRIVSQEIKVKTSGGQEETITFINPEKSGWLTKQGGRIKTWKKRFFLLSYNCLYYFKEINDPEPCGIIPLDDVRISVIEPKGKKRLFLFEISSQKKETFVKGAKFTNSGQLVTGHHKSYLISAETEEERDTWITEIQNNVAGNQLGKIVDKKKSQLKKKN
ncbi:cytohesin 4a-related [Anaeramoeba flamelloides]|uniref:Cytohesin 4a-related n=1 Tax=Anaeramoeba flamelloides TaxID=1746091 RepID=A0AAV7YSC6_9EUKA|nr:cytohesin 4a-related [Anaeramoeba flamelloides]